MTDFNVVENSGHFILMKIMFGRKMKFASLYINLFVLEMIKYPILAESVEPWSTYMH